MKLVISMTYDIDIIKTSKKFGEVTAIDDLTLQVKQSKVFCLVGPNASGKTTTIRLLLGILNPYAGSLTVKGFSIPRMKKKLRYIMGYLPQGEFTSAICYFWEKDLVVSLRMNLG